MAAPSPAHPLRVALILLLACRVSAAGPPPASKWLRVETPHFELVGEVGEGTLKRVAERFEQFREVFARLFPATRQALPARTLIVVFGSTRGYQPFMPVYNGKRVEVGGYFQGSPATSFITLSTDAGERAYPTIFHEYTHLLVDNALADVPLWFNEGLAEYYSTFAMVGAREAVIGKVQESHVHELRERFVPLAELLAVGHESPLYNEGDRRSIFYAESWALVHYLLLGNPARRPQLSAFLEQYASGVPAAQAFGAAFGTTAAALEKELKGYVQRSIYQSQIYKFTDTVTVARDWRVTPLGEGDGQAALAELLYFMGRTSEAAARAEAALAQAPGHPRLQAVLGRARQKQGRHDEAATLLAQATAAAGDDVEPLYARAAALLQPAGDGAPMPDAATARTMVPLLERVVAARPALAHAQMLLAYAHLLLQDGTAALAPATAAFKLSPRHEYAYMVAQAHVLSRDPGRARPILTQLMERGSTPGIRQDARALLARLDTWERQRTGLPAPPAPGAAPAGGPSAEDERASSRFRPVFREVLAGETRELGLLESIDCGGHGVEFRVKLADRVIRVLAKTFDAVQLISYRNEAPGRVSCGPRPGSERIYVTFRTGGAVPAGVAGAAVAIELLPDGYTP